MLKVQVDEPMSVDQILKMSHQELEEAAEEKLAVARGICQVRAPYLIAAVYSFIPCPVLGFGTMGVTKGLILIYCPAFVLMRTNDQVAFLLLHEVMHVVRQHAERCGGNDHELFNKAGDLAINPDLIDAGWKMPDGYATGLLPEQFGFKKGLSSEEYYDLLQKLPQPLKQGGGSSKGQSEGQSSKGLPHGQGQKPGCGQGKCGGIAGNPIDKELEDRLDKESGRSPAAKKGLEKQLSEDIRRHVAEKGRGTVPASLVSWAQQDRTKKSKIPWPRKLASVLRKTSGRIQSGGMDFSLARPAKSSYLRGIIRPGLVQQEPEAAFILDTSGSMGPEQLRAALREAQAVMTSVGIEQVWWLEADAAVANIPKRIGVKQLSSIELHGGGGTDFCPAIEACTKLRPKPDIIMYFTDGDGNAPPNAPPGVAFIWCIVPGHYNRRPAPWGLAIIMRKDGDTAEYPAFEDDEDEEEVEVDP